MPNMLVFNKVAEQLQTLISGVDSTGQTRKILTDSDGRIQIMGTFTANTQLSGRAFTESYTSLSAVTDSAAIFIQNTSEQSLYSFYIFNTGVNTVTVQLQISPTTTYAYFVDDPSGSIGLGAGQKTTLVTSRFLKYTRLFYETSGAACTFEVYYNAHI